MGLRVHVLRYRSAFRVSEGIQAMAAAWASTQTRPSALAFSGAAKVPRVEAKRRSAPWFGQKVSVTVEECLKSYAGLLNPF